MDPTQNLFETQSFDDFFDFKDDDTLSQQILKDQDLFKDEQEFQPSILPTPQVDTLQISQTPPALTVPNTQPPQEEQKSPRKRENQDEKQSARPAKKKKSTKKKKKKEEDENVDTQTTSQIQDELLQQMLSPKDKQVYLLDMTDEEVLRVVKEKYQQMSQKNQAEILKKRRELLAVLANSTQELNATIQQFHIRFLQLLAQEEQSRRVTENEKQDRINKFYQKVSYWQLEMKQQCEQVFRQYIAKLGKRRNRTLPPEATKILKEWFLNHYKHPYPT